MLFQELTDALCVTSIVHRKLLEGLDAARNPGWLLARIAERGQVHLGSMAVKSRTPHGPVKAPTLKHSVDDVLSRQGKSNQISRARMVE